MKPIIPILYRIVDEARKLAHPESELAGLLLDLKEAQNENKAEREASYAPCVVCGRPCTVGRPCSIGCTLEDQ